MLSQQFIQGQLNVKSIAKPYFKYKLYCWSFIATLILEFHNKYYHARHACDENEFSRIFKFAVKEAAIFL